MARRVAGRNFLLFMNYREFKLNYSVKQSAALTIFYIFMPTSFALAAFPILSLMTRQGTGVFPIASVQVYSLMFCYATNTLAVTAINTKWKISAHAVGASGPLTSLAITFGWEVLPLFVLMLVVAWARIELKAHTRSQVTAGALLGILLTGVQVEAFHKIAGAR